MFVYGEWRSREWSPGVGISNPAKSVAVQDLTAIGTVTTGDQMTAQEKALKLLAKLYLEAQPSLKPTIAHYLKKIHADCK